MFKHPIFVLEILITPNDIYFINNNIFKLVIKSILFILNCFLQKLRLRSGYNFWQYKDNIVSAFIKPALDARIFSKSS